MMLDNFNRIRDRGKVVKISRRVCMPTDVMVTLLRSFEEGTHILGFYDAIESNCYAVVLVNENWPEIPEGNRFPEVVVKITEDDEGDVTVEILNETN